MIFTQGLPLTITNCEVIQVAELGQPGNIPCMPEHVYGAKQGTAGHGQDGFRVQQAARVARAPTTREPDFYFLPFLSLAQALKGKHSCFKAEPSDHSAARRVVLLLEASESQLGELWKFRRSAERRRS
jgi:hypothetical protein